MPLQVEYTFMEAHFYFSGHAGAGLTLRSFTFHCLMSRLLVTASVFGELWRLEPLPMKRRTMWRREMEWMLSVSDHIVELVPSWQRYPDGSTMEVRGCLGPDYLFPFKA